MITKRKVTLSIITVAFLLTSIFVPALAASYSDVPDGVWYSDACSKWGYLLDLKDGDDLQPDAQVTRAEIFHVLNNLLGFGQADTTFTDAVSHKYAKDIGAFEKAGVIKGAGDGTCLPDELFTRWQAAILFGQVLGLELDVKGFDYADAADLAAVNPQAARYQGALNRSGYYNGTNTAYTNPNEKVFSPNLPFSRAEIFGLVNNMAKGGYIASATKDFTAPDNRVEGNMIIAADAKISDVSIVGDLVIAPKLGNGEVTLDNVIVTGSLFVRGGGVNSIIITGEQSKIGRIVVDNAGSSAVRISVEGNAVVTAIVLTSAASEVVVEGTVALVLVAPEAAGVVLVIQNADVEELVVTAMCEVTIDEDSVVEALEVFSDKAEIDNAGVIESAVVVEGLVITGNAPEEEEIMDSALSDIYAG